MTNDTENPGQGKDKAMQDKEIMSIVMQLGENLSKKLDTGFESVYHRFDKLPCAVQKQEIAVNKTNLENLKNEFSRYATVHDNYHLLYIKKWRWVIGICMSAVVAMAAVLGVVIKFTK